MPDGTLTPWEQAVRNYLRDAEPDPRGEVCGLCPRCEAMKFMYACGQVHDCDLCKIKRGEL